MVRKETLVDGIEIMAGVAEKSGTAIAGTSVQAGAPAASLFTETNKGIATLSERTEGQTDSVQWLWRQNERLRAEVEELQTAVRAAKGYLLNAKIDLETGAPKRIAIATIDGGLAVVDVAISNFIYGVIRE